MRLESAELGRKSVNAIAALVTQSARVARAVSISNTRNISASNTMSLLSLRLDALPAARPIQLITREILFVSAVTRNAIISTTFKSYLNYIHRQSARDVVLLSLSRIMKFNRILNFCNVYGNICFTQNHF